MKAYAFLIILLIGIPLLLISVQQVPNGCECQGIGTTKCLGKINCEYQEQDCIPLTCDLKDVFLGINNSKIDLAKTYTILVIDASKSMEGENLNATIKASKEFVQKINEQEHVAVIEFNERGQILTKFTSDKVKLFTSIELINPRGRTRFLEPFTLANELFEQVPLDANKYILFLSDGEPEDDEEAYMKEIALLQEKNVHVYAVAFAGKSNEELMKHIAGHSSNLFLVRDAQDIQEKFAQVYTTIREGRDISIQVKEQPTNAYNEESIKTTLHSNYNQQNILAQQTYCSFATSDYLEAKNEKNQFSRIKGEQDEEHIAYPLHELSSGTYSLTAYSRVLLEGCSFHAVLPLEPLTILSKQACTTTCDNIHTLMKEDKEYAYIRDQDEPISWTILIDKSSSMESRKHLEKAIEDTRTFISLLPVQDSITVGSFDTKTELLTYHQQPFLFNQTVLTSIASSASTNLRFAFEKAQFLEQVAPHMQTHTIIISDGKFGTDYLEEINSSLQQIMGCISTINYGVHLLTDSEQAFTLIQQGRTCGLDYITRPTKQELQQLARTNMTDTPHLIIQLREDLNSTKKRLEVETISSFTGEPPHLLTEHCQEKPLVEITITNSQGTQETLRDSTFYLDENETYSVTSFFDYPTCSYSTTIHSQPPVQEVKNTLLKIVLSVVLVLLIHLVVFTIVMNKKLKKLEQLFRKRK